MSPPAPVTAVLLDMDGTLIDSNEAHARSWQEALAGFGCHVTLQETAHQIGKGSDQLMPIFVSEERIAREGEAIAKRAKEIFSEKYQDGLRCFPGSRELVQRLLAEGRQVVLASSAAADQLEFFMRVAGVDDLIKTTTSRDDAQRSKPHPDIFEAALAKLTRVPREQVIVIGDSPYDIQAARKAGLRTIGVLSGDFPEAELRDAGCTDIYRDIADLLARYDSSPLAR